MRLDILKKRMRVVTIRLKIFFRRKKFFEISMIKMKLFLFVIKEKVLFLVKSILFLLVIVTASYRVRMIWSKISTPISIILPNATCCLFRDTNRTEIRSLTNKHEWRSVSFIRQSRSLHDSRFMLSSLKEGQANILGTTKRRVPLAEKQKGSFKSIAALATLRRDHWNTLFNLDLDREVININRPAPENPLFKELKPDDLELVELIRQGYAPIEIERIASEEQSQSSSSDDEGLARLFEEQSQSSSPDDEGLPRFISDNEELDRLIEEQSQSSSPDDEGLARLPRLFEEQSQSPSSDDKILDPLIEEQSQSSSPDDEGLAGLARLFEEQSQSPSSDNEELDPLIEEQSQSSSSDDEELLQWIQQGRTAPSQIAMIRRTSFNVKLSISET